MKEEKNEQATLGGFEAILDNFIPGKDGGLRDPLKVEEPVDDDELDQIKNSKDPVAEKVKQDTAKQEQWSNTVTDVDDEESDSAHTDADDEKELDEANKVTAFFDAFADEFGWEFNEDEDKPQTVEEMVDYFRDVIDENSQPEYSSDEVAAIDEFVRQGGNLDDYFQIGHSINFDTIDTDNENNLKLILQNYLELKGVRPDRIESRIEKYEKSGTLKEEAEDAVDSLRLLQQQQRVLLLLRQKADYELAMQQQQNFYNTVVNEISDLQDIRGISIPNKDKRALVDYILKPEADGRTRYQKDYARGGVKNLIESAYFTMNADKLLGEAKKQGNNQAIDRFRRSLKSSSINTKSKSQGASNNDDPIWLSAARTLRRS